MSLPLAVLLTACDGPVTRRIVPTPQDHAVAVAFLQQLKEAGGLTRYSCENREALITPATWRLADADQKESLTIAVFAACDGAFIHVIDSQSGKQLAHIGPGGYAVD